MTEDWGRTAGSPADGFSQPTYHQLQSPPANPTPARTESGSVAPDQAQNPRTSRRRGPQRPQSTGDVTVTRAVVARSQYFSRLLAHKVISASEADGAKESGLTALIWNQVMSYAADAMVTVALAGTVFFSAPSEAQRGNVLLYLLMTMAPFAVVAPVIGPALDRVQHGRRWAMAGTAVGRGVLAIVMAMNFTDLFVLFPAALGSLVLSKAYSVIRSAAAPRLVPTNLTLVEANARLSIFGLAAAIIGGGIVGVAIKLSGSYPLGLWITAAAFAATAVYSFRLPKIVDSLPPASRPDEAERAANARPKSRAQRRVGRAPLPRRLLDWARRGYTPPVVLALQGESALRWLSGFLTLFLAFYIESTSHGWQAVASLGAIGAATGVGNFVGTGVGTRLKLVRPDLIILLCAAMSAVGCLAGTLLFSLAMAIVATLLSSVSNSLAKLSLDAIIQRDVDESLRSSAFGRSETFLQLSWVLGATIAILLPAKDGQLGFIVAAVVMLATAVFMLLRERVARSQRHTSHVSTDGGYASR
jgi:MFS family permease